MNSKHTKARITIEITNFAMTYSIRQIPISNEVIERPLKSLKIPSK